MEFLLERLAFWKAVVHRGWLVTLGVWEVLSAAFHFRDNFLSEPLKQRLDTQAFIEFWDWHVWVIGSLVIMLAAALEGCFRKHKEILAKATTKHSQAVGLKETELSTAQAELAGLQEQLTRPQLVVEVLSYETEEVDTQNLSPLSVYITGETKDTLFKVFIQISNAHRVTTVAQGYWLTIKRLHSDSEIALLPALPAATLMPLLDPRAKMEYAVPVSGWMVFRMERSPLIALVNGTFQLHVRDGVGATASSGERTIDVPHRLPLLPLH